MSSHGNSEIFGNLRAYLDDSAGDLFTSHNKLGKSSIFFLN